MTQLPRLLITPLALAAALTLLSACEKKSVAKSAPPPQAVPVAVTPAKVAPVQRGVDVVGTLFGEEETVVSAKVPGRIIALYKDIGDVVQPGEPLVQLKQNDYQLAVNKAQLAMEEALSKLGLKELPPRDFDVTKTPMVVRAKLQQENALSRFNRAKQLFEATPPLMSEQEYSDLETALRVARSNYDVELIAARNIVAQAYALKADVEIAAQRLTDATTRAPSTPEPTTQPVDTGQAPGQPHTYVVTQRMVNVGELVREITPAYRLVDVSPIKLRAMVPERYVAQVQKGQKVRVQTEAYPNVDFWGTVSRVNPQVTVENRTFGIEVLLPNDDARLRPGAFARATVQTRVEDNVVFAPQAAVVSFAGVTKVFTVGDDGKAKEINVDVGPATIDNGAYVEITKGLKGQEKLVTQNAGKLANGVAVTVQAPTPTPTPTPTTQATTRPTP